MKEHSLPEFRAELQKKSLQEHYARCYFLKHFYNFPSQKIDGSSISVILLRGNIEVSQDISNNAKATLAQNV